MLQLLLCNDGKVFHNITNFNLILLADTSFLSLKDTKGGSKVEVSRDCMNLSPGQRDSQVDASLQNQNLYTDL